MAFTAADAMSLPFADESFDVVTMSFGLRNVADAETALREFLRVTKPGGRLLVCEFSQPVNKAFRTVYIELPHARAAAGGPPHVEQPRLLRLPRRVDPRVAAAGRARRAPSRRPAGSRSAGPTSPAASSRSTTDQALTPSAPACTRGSVSGDRGAGPGLAAGLSRVRHALSDKARKRGNRLPK